MTKYKTIIIDPPWEYGTWGKASDSSTSRKKFPNGQWQENFALPYNSMTIKNIKDLPVNNLMDENCEVYLWVTQKYLPEAFGILQVWGLKYCQTLTWCKTPRGTGQGGIFCPTTEFLILARRGKMPKVKRVDSTWWQVKRQKRHSQKPVFFHELIESVTDSPRLEMFARNQREGWDVFGNEVENSISIF